MGLIRWILRKNKKKEQIKKQVYETKADVEFMKKYLNEIMQKHLGQIMGEKDRLEEELKQAKERIAELEGKRLAEELEEARKQEEFIKRDRKKKRKIFLFDEKETKLPFLVSAYDDYDFFRDKNGKEWKLWKGVMLEKTPSGVIFNFIVKNPGNDEELGIIKGVSLDHLPYLFDTKTIVSDCRVGRIPINLTRDGEFIPPVMMGEPVSAEDFEKNEEVKRMLQIDIKSIFKNADEKTKMAFFSLYKSYLKALGYAEEAEEREKAALMEKIESDIASKSSMKMVEGALPSLSYVANKLENFYSNLAPTIVSEQESRAKAAGAEALVKASWDVIDDLINRIKQAGLSKDERARRQIEDELEFLLKRIESIGKTKKKKPEETEESEEA